MLVLLGFPEDLTYNYNLQLRPAGVEWELQAIESGP